MEKIEKFIRHSPIITRRYETGALLMALSALRRFYDKLERVVHLKKKAKVTSTQLAFMTSKKT